MELGMVEGEKSSACETKCGMVMSKEISKTEIWVGWAAVPVQPKGQDGDKGKESTAAFWYS